MLRTSPNASCGRCAAEGEERFRRRRKRTVEGVLIHDHGGFSMPVRPLPGCLGIASKSADPARPTTLSFQSIGPQAQQRGRAPTTKPMKLPVYAGWLQFPIADYGRPIPSRVSTPGSWPSRYSRMEAGGGAHREQADCLDKPRTPFAWRFQHRITLLESWCRTFVRLGQFGSHRFRRPSVSAAKEMPWRVEARQR